MTEYRVGSVEDVQEGRVTIVIADGVEVGVLKVRGEIRAFENRCPHQGGPVCQGELLPQIEAVIDADGHIAGERFSQEHFNLICPWHGWSFDALSGRCISDPRLRLRPWDVIEREGELLIRRRSGKGEPA